MTRRILLVLVASAGISVAVLAPQAGGTVDARGSFSVSINAPVSEGAPHSERVTSPYVSSTVTGSGTFAVGPLHGSGTDRYRWGALSGVAGTITVTHRYTNAADNSACTITFDPNKGTYQLTRQGNSYLDLRGTASGGCSGSGEVQINTTDVQRLYLNFCYGDDWKAGASVQTTIRAGTTPPATMRHTWAVSGRTTADTSIGHVVITTSGSGTADVSPSGAATKAAGSITFDRHVLGKESAESRHYVFRVVGGGSFRRSSGVVDYLVLKATVANLKSSSAECLGEPDGTLLLTDGGGQIDDSFGIRTLCELKYTTGDVKVNIR